MYGDIILTYLYYVLMHLYVPTIVFEIIFSIHSQEKKC